MQYMQCPARHNNNIVSNEDVLIENIFKLVSYTILKISQFHRWFSKKSCTAEVPRRAPARWCFVEAAPEDDLSTFFIQQFDHVITSIVSCSIMVCWMMIISYDTFSNIMDRASSSSLFRYVRVHFATFKSHARTSLREVVVDPIAGDFSIPKLMSRARAFMQILAMIYTDGW